MESTQQCFLPVTRRIHSVHGKLNAKQYCNSPCLEACFKRRRFDRLTRLARAKLRLNTSTMQSIACRPQNQYVVSTCIDSNWSSDLENSLKPGWGEVWTLWDRTLNSYLLTSLDPWCEACTLWTPIWTFPAEQVETWPELDEQGGLFGRVGL